MIIVRAPLRITLGGGGTDLPAYAEKHGGFCVSAAIDKYVYVTVTRPFKPGIYLKYSEIEHVERVEDVRHPGFRKYFAGRETNYFEATTLADIPSGTGLGSSGAFAAALITAEYAQRRLPLDAHNIAEFAYGLEEAAAGRQDPYISTYGGVAALDFNAAGASATPVKTDTDTPEDNLLLFFTGFTRAASEALKGQAEQTDNLHRVKENGLKSYDALKAEDFSTFAALMNEQWRLKVLRTGVDARIDRWRTWGLEAGAIGAKLVGAGGGGFLLFYAEEKRKLREAMREAGLPEVRFRFDYEGAKVLVNS